MLADGDRESVDAGITDSGESLSSRSYKQYGEVGSKTREDDVPCVRLGPLENDFLTASYDSGSESRSHYQVNFSSHYRQVLLNL